MLKSWDWEIFSLLSRSHIPYILWQEKMIIQHERIAFLFGFTGFTEEKLLLTSNIEPRRKVFQFFDSLVEFFVHKINRAISNIWTVMCGKIVLLMELNWMTNNIMQWTRQLKMCLIIFYVVNNIFFIRVSRLSLSLHTKFFDFGSINTFTHRKFRSHRKNNFKVIDKRNEEKKMERRKIKISRLMTQLISPERKQKRHNAEGETWGKWVNFPISSQP